MNLLLYKFATGLASLIKGQAEITNMAPMIEGTRGPMANIVSTVMEDLGDGKLFRTSGANSSLQAGRIQKRHSPNTHREIGKRAADESVLEQAKNKYPLTRHSTALLAAAALPPIVYGVTRGIEDRHKTVPAKTMAEVIGVGAGAGALAGAAHTLLFPEVYGPNKGQFKSKLMTPALLALGFGAVGAASYGAGRLEHPLADKLIYKQEHHHYAS